MKIMKLGELVNIRTGKLDANASNEDGRYPFFTCSVTPLKINTYSYDTECVLVAGNGDLNVKYYKGKFDAYQRTYIIESINKEVLNVKYLFHFLEKYVEKLRSQSIGGVIKYIKLGNLTEALIPVCSVDIQKQIVDVLEKSKLLIEKRQSQITALDEITQSLFLEMFGDPAANTRKWELAELSELAEIKIGPFGTLLHKEDYISGGHPLVNPSHIVDGKICYNSNWSISDEKYLELEPYNLKIGDLVLGRRGEMGRCAVVNEDGLLCGTGSMIIRSKGDIHPEIMQKIISFPTFKKTIEEKAVGQTMLNLNVPIVSKLLLPKIPMKVQEEYFDFVKKIDKSKLAMQKSLDEFETIYQSLMQKAYKGELFQEQ